MLAQSMATLKNSIKKHPPQYKVRRNKSNLANGITQHKCHTLILEQSNTSSQITSE